MRNVHRVLGAFLIMSFSAAPLGVAAEGYVCASGVRMVHGAAAPAGCAHCAPTDAGRRATFERPCCVYVGATALPPVLTATAVALAAPVRAAAAVPPGMATSAAPAIDPAGVPAFASGGNGPSPPTFRLPQSVQLRN